MPPCEGCRAGGRERGKSIDLPEEARLQNFAELDGVKNFADVRIGWNEMGLAIQVEVKRKEQPPVGDADRVRSSDGLSLWIDTRELRASHRASRYCHHFLFLPTGGGADKEDPVHRAIEDQPSTTGCAAGQPRGHPLSGHRLKGGYRLEAFLPAAALYGFDPVEHPRLGIYYVVRDQELGDQFLSVSWDFPFSDDPSLWSVLESGEVIDNQPARAGRLSLQFK